MFAMDVFSAAIGYLQRHVIQCCEKQGFSLSPHEIKWVLTVPAIWGDAAKQFMRKAAEQVCIYQFLYLSNNLKICLTSVMNLYTQTYMYNGPGHIFIQYAVYIIKTTLLY